MKRLQAHLRRYLEGPMVRPFALAGPILVLLIALPLLRPLRHPAEMNNDEMLRLATIRALVEHHSPNLGRGFARIPGAVETPSGVYSAQPPMMAVLLSAPAWVMNRFGIDFDDNQTLMEYMLTVLGVTLPAALAAGLIYRMGRLFELRRRWRSLLGFCVVAGSGLLSYSVVLNAQVPAAVLVLASAACLVHVAAMNRDDRRAGWFALAGGCSALAATIDPAAAVLLLLLMCVIPTMRFSVPRRIVGVLLYILGAIPVIAVHAAWNIPVTGDIVPASVQPLIVGRPTVTPVVAARDEWDEEITRSTLDAVGSHAMWFMHATIGRHGVLSHFPVVMLGILGIGAVMHRHWPSSTKILAAASAVSAILIVILYRRARVDWSGAMFASRWFVVFLPLLLFWAGAWLRRSHTPAVWTTAAVLLLVSGIVGLIGATDPMPRHGFEHYTAAEAVGRLFNSGNVDSAVLVGRDPKSSLTK